MLKAVTNLKEIWPVTLSAIYLIHHYCIGHIERKLSELLQVDCKPLQMSCFVLRLCE